AALGPGRRASRHQTGQPPGEGRTSAAGRRVGSGDQTLALASGRDLANMMLTLALQSDADTVYARATRVFTPDEIAEAFASAVGLAIPTQLQARLKAD